MYPLFNEHMGEILQQRVQAVLGPARDVFMEHQSLAEPRVGALPGDRASAGNPTGGMGRDEGSGAMC